MLENKRNFILLGHAHCGKTSLAESLLFATKATTRKGTVEEGNTVSDYNNDEATRKISISASFLNLNYKNHVIQIIDAPGYADFVGEVVSCAYAVDAVVLIVDAVNGVSVGTEFAWGLAEKLKLPMIVFINKLDKDNTSFEKTLDDIKSAFGNKFFVLGKLDDQSLIEVVAESDDKLLEKYLDSGTLSQEEVAHGLREAIDNAKLFPVIEGSVAQQKGINELLQAIVDYLPSPLERPAIETKTDSGEVKQLDFKDNELSGFVFKSLIDPYVGQLNIIRIFSGTLKANTFFYNISRSLKERIGSIYIMQGKEQKTVEEATAGDIIAVAKLKDTHSGDSLSNDDKGFIFSPLPFPESAISFSVKPKSREDEEKISGALTKLANEDPTFKVGRDLQTKELIISGFGELHLDVMISRLKERFKVEVELGTPKIPYKETIRKSSKAQGKYKKQSGGRGQYGDVWIEIQPLTRGGGFEFVDKIFGGAIPKNYVPSVEKGIRQTMSRGVVAGCSVEDIKVIVYDGSYHSVDSSDMAFQIAGRMAFKKAVQEAGPVLLEPIMDVEISISEDFLGQISGDINSRRGKVMGMEVKGKTQLVKAKVPLSEMFKYANNLRSMTGGRGSYVMRFSSYEEVPSRVASTIIDNYQKTQKHEEE
ncbi:MAG: elongation factor G [Candidatus Gygaella obscura]|nr:elongation factor G [Candidatus Gygaella obscura]